MTRDFSGWKAIVKCATCGRDLFTSRERSIGTIPEGHMYAGMPGKETEYRARPWQALVINRKRDVDYDPNFVAGLNSPSGVRLPNGEVVKITERPTVCSRACLHGLDPSWARAEFEPSDQITAELHPATIKDGDDLLCPIVGSGGAAMPDVPSDVWLDPVERDRAHPRATPPGWWDR